MWDMVDPVNWFERLEKIPKFVTVSSDDEFMMMDQTNIYWD
jgi:PhoPQ-activated pathogenicity-related protein